MRGTVGTFLPSRTGTAAVEFAILSSVFLLLLFGCLQVGYLLFLQHRLDDVTAGAVRSIQLGSVQKGSADTAEKFKTAFLCPALGSLFDCASLIADSRVMASATADFDGTLWARTPVASQIDTPYCVGSAGEYMFLRISYPSMPLVAGLLPASMFQTFEGRPALMLQSFAALRVEPVDVRRMGLCS